MTDTIFGKIIRREIPATIVYEDDEVLGFQDIAPQAPVHVLFIPKQHAIPTLDDVPPEQALLVGQLAIAAAAYARAQGLAQDGYRIVMNCREHAGQTVFHIHLHLLAGAPLGRFGTRDASVDRALRAVGIARRSSRTYKNAAPCERRFCE